MWRQILTGRFLTAASVRRDLTVDHFNPECVQRRWKSTVKMTKQLKRMIDRSGGSKKKKLFPGPVNLRINSSSELSGVSPVRKPVYTEGQKRRAHQAGRVLYDNIVHLVNSGQLSDRLAAMAVEIVKVKVVPDFSVANVYWLSSGTAEDEELQSLLSSNAGHLRHLLTSMHVLGSIPRICFVRDDSHARYMAVNTLLRTADFGPDFVPTRLDSSIRDSGGWREGQDIDSTEDTLQESFNRLSVNNATHDSSFQLGTSGEEENTPSHVRETVSSQDNGQVFDASFQEKVCVNEEKNDFVARLDSQKHNVGQDRSSTGWKTLNSESISVETDAPSASDTCQQDGRSQTSSQTQASSFDSQQLHSQSVPTVHSKAHNSQRVVSANLENASDALKKVFRDDLYKVPHSQLLSKVLMKKQKAGTRPIVQPVDTESENVVPKVNSANLKSVLQKKDKARGRVKRQGDYDHRDLLVTTNHHVNDDLYEEQDEELDHDLSAFDDQIKHK